MNNDEDDNNNEGNNGNDILNLEKSFDAANDHNTNKEFEEKCDSRVDMDLGSKEKSNSGSEEESNSGSEDE